MNQARSPGICSWPKAQPRRGCSARSLEPKPHSWRTRGASRALGDPNPNSPVRNLFRRDIEMAKKLAASAASPRSKSTGRSGRNATAKLAKLSSFDAARYLESEESGSRPSCASHGHSASGCTRPRPESGSFPRHDRCPTPAHRGRAPERRRSRTPSSGARTAPQSYADQLTSFRNLS